MSRIKIHNPRAISQANQRPNLRPNKILSNNGAATTQEETPALAALRQLQDQNATLQAQNQEFQDQLDRIADLAGCDDPKNCQEGEDELVERLNDILDVAAGGDVDEDDEDDDSGE